MIFDLVIFLLVISLVIFVHELGHFIFAKRANILCHEFALGMGPVIWQTKKGETLYSIRAIPLGGFVSMAGENTERDKDVDPNRVFQAQSWPHRFITVIAGALFNFLLAFILIFLIGLFYGSTKTNTIINNVQENSPADKAGIIIGDEITHINGVRVRTLDEVTFEIQASSGAPLELKLKTENGKTKTVTLTPEKTTVEGMDYYYIGVSTLIEREHGLISALSYTHQKFIGTVKMVFRTFYLLITGTLGFENVSGPIGILSIAGSQAEAGLNNLLFFIAYISINLGFVNLLPLPALDGGRILFLLIEKLLGRPVKPEVENYIHYIGLIGFMILFVFIAWNDILRLL